MSGGKVSGDKVSGGKMSGGKVSHYHPKHSTKLPHIRG